MTGGRGSLGDRWARSGPAAVTSFLRGDDAHGWGPVFGGEFYGMAASVTVLVRTRNAILAPKFSRIMPNYVHGVLVIDTTGAVDIAGQSDRLAISGRARALCSAEHVLSEGAITGLAGRRLPRKSADLDGLAFRPWRMQIGDWSTRAARNRGRL